MDALRRAEEEKKQAAKEKQNQIEPPTPPPANAEVDAPEEELGATVKLDRLPLPIASKQNAATTPDSGAPLEALNDLNVDFESTSPRIKLPVEESSGTDQQDTFEFSVADQDPNSIDGGPASDDTADYSINAEYATEKFAAPLSLEPLQDSGAHASANDASDNTQLPPSEVRGSAPGPDVTNDTDPLLAAHASDTTLETSSGQTAVAAHTVFEAGSAGISKRIILWTLALGIAVIGLLVVSGVYYFQQTPTTRPLPSPVASVELEKGRDLAATAPAFEREIPSTEKAASTAQPPVAEKAAADEPSSSSPVNAASSDATIASDTQALTAPEDAASISARTRAETGDRQTLKSKSESASERSLTEVSAGTEPSTDQRDSFQANTAVPTVNSKRLSIAKSVRAKQSSEKVTLAYAAYQAGEYSRAETLYQQALTIRPQDINALNGLGALALHANDKERAHQFYSRVLKLDPNNATASTAIFQIEGGVGNRVTESQLKLMLDNGGDPGTINFALGSLYSRHQRWNDAQLAYFEAMRHRPHNPDYLYNLAVSLDQIGQRKAAVDYYQKALVAADEHGGAFNEAQVLARIQAISTQRAVSDSQ